MKVWELKNEWYTADESGVKTELYSTYEKALTAFNKVVEEELSEDWKGAFNEDGTLRENYGMDRMKDYFEIFEDGFHSSSSTTVSITEKEVL